MNFEEMLDLMPELIHQRPEQVGSFVNLFD